MKKKIKDFNLIEHIRSYFKLYAYKDIISWSEQNIDFSEDISAERNKLDFELYPYQVPILKEWQMKKGVIKTIVVVAPEQVGKTNMFVVGLLYNMEFSPCQSMIVYPSDELAVATNQTKLLPLMRHIPVLKQELQRPRSYRGDCYKFSNLISYFSGAGSKIVSKSCKIVIGDQIDSWPQIGKLDNVADLKKRTRSYNESICFLISTPSQQNGKIWKNFLKGSQGYWYLRCKGCGELTMKSCDIHNLQFESDFNEELGERIVRTDSIRLICPKCGYQHVESDKKWMNMKGGYIHLIPDRIKTAPSFQLGALASQLPSLDWTTIANAQLEAGKRADIEAQITFDNSFRGLPYKRRQIVKQDMERLKEHEWTAKEILKQEDIEFIFAAVDSMDDFWRYGVFASDVKDNIHVIQVGQIRYLSLSEEDRKQIDATGKHEAYLAGIDYTPVQTLEDILNKQYYGFNILLCGQDAHAGHNFTLVNQFIKDHRNMVGYLGARLQNERYKSSENENLPRNFIVNARHYQVETIYYLYSQKERGEEYLYFNTNIEKKYLDQIAAVRPDVNRKFGHNPQNWTNENRNDHAFDVIKMGYWVRDLCIEHLEQKRFNYAQSPRLKRRFEKKIKKEIKQVHQEVRNTMGTNNWLEI